LNEETTFVCIFIVLGGVFGLAANLLMLFSSKKALKGTGEIIAAGNRDGFMQAMLSFLNTKFSTNQLFASNPPGTVLEAYEYFSNWMKRFIGNPWKSLFIIVVLQSLFGLGALYAQPENLSMGTVIVFLITCTALVILITALNLWRFSRKTLILRIIDKRFRKLVEEDRAALAKSGPEVQNKQAYRLSALRAEPVIPTNHYR
jgi:hypothetical protein